MKQKQKTPYQIIVPALDIFKEIIGAGISADARLVCLNVFLRNLKVLEIDGVAKTLNMRYAQALAACRELRARGYLKSLGSDIYEITNPVGLKDVGFSEVEDGESEV